MALSGTVRKIATALNRSSKQTAEPAKPEPTKSESAESESALFEGVSTLEQRKFWQENGFLILHGLISADVIAEVSDEIERTIKNRHEFQNVKVDALEGSLAGRRMPISEAPDEVFAASFKLNDLYLESPIVRKAVLDNSLVAILSELLGGDPIVINSLNFVRGSQQPSHFDTWYMPPPVPNKLIVSSICLEDIHVDAGPLFYYPGSHLIPPYRFSHGGIHAIEAEMGTCRAYLDEEIAKRGLQKTAFLGSAGDTFLWHAQLLHGGLQIREPARTRKSLVTHYWRMKDVPSESVGVFEGNKYFYQRSHQA